MNFDEWWESACKYWNPIPRDKTIAATAWLASREDVEEKLAIAVEALDGVARIYVNKRKGILGCEWLDAVREALATINAKEKGE